MNKQGNMPHNQEITQLIERVPQMTNIELTNRHFKTAIINMLKDSKKSRNTMKREMEDIKRTK